MFPIHPLCALFPDMDADQFSDLASSIQETGFDPNRPALIYLGQIVDGRHRQKIANLLKIELPTKEWTPATDDPEMELLEFLLSENLRRRHLTPSQRAIVVSKAADLKRGRPHTVNKYIRNEDGLKTQPITVEQAASIANVSLKTIERAKEINKKGSEELQKAVLDDKISLTDASKIVDLPKTEQDKAVQAVKAGKAKTVSAASGKKKPPKPAAPEPADGPTDAYGNQVPDRFKTVFAYRELFRAYDKLHNPRIGELAVNFAREVFPPDGKGMLDHKRITDSLAIIYSILMPWQPESVCECGGENKACRDCQGRGWIRKGPLK